MMRGDLARQQLDRRLARFRATTEYERPRLGWLRAIREALGMTAAQLAARIGVSQPRVMAMEKAEQRGAITLETLSRAAEALDCELLYVLVPNTSLNATLREQARKVATEQLNHVSHSMRLENQGSDDEDALAERERLIEELLRGNIRRLWDEP